jgi:hypothetical protein
MDEVFGKVTRGTAPDSAHQSLYPSALRPHTVRSLLPDCGPFRKTQSMSSVLVRSLMNALGVRFSEAVPCRWDLRFSQRRL